MKKIAFIIACVLLAVVKIFKLDSFLVKEINIGAIISNITADNSSQEVSLVYLDVLDYYEEDSYLYIKPLENTIKIPYSGLITNTSNQLVIEGKTGIIKIEGIDSLKYHLYQYYDSLQVLGYSECIKISGDYLQLISSLRIVNVKV